ncbi:MAG: hypothetical protein ACPLQO_07310 [Desulfotomaculales bacterium]
MAVVMKNSNTRAGSFFLLVVLLLLILSIVFITWWFCGVAGNDITSAIEQVNSLCQEEELALSMVRKSLLNKQGLIVQKVEEGYPSNHALLESMGQLLEYAVLAGDENLFSAALKVTFGSFITGEGYYTWRHVHELPGNRRRHKGF